MYKKTIAFELKLSMRKVIYSSISSIVFEDYFNWSKNIPIDLEEQWENASLIDHFAPVDLFWALAAKWLLGPQEAMHVIAAMQTFGRRNDITPFFTINPDFTDPDEPHEPSRGITSEVVPYA